MYFQKRHIVHVVVLDYLNGVCCTVILKSRKEIAAIADDMMIGQYISVGIYNYARSAAYHIAELVAHGYHYHGFCEPCYLLGRKLPLSAPLHRCRCTAIYRSWYAAIHHGRRTAVHGRGSLCAIFLRERREVVFCFRDITVSFKRDILRCDGGKRLL